MTDGEAKRMIARLFAAYPVEIRNLSADESRVTAHVYAQALADLDPRLLVAAVDRLIASSERLPTIAKIRQTVVEIQHGRSRPGGDAWGDVVRAMKRYGYVRTPGVDFQFDDPLVARAVAAMSWSELCRSENAIADRARFIELYGSLADNARADAQLAAGGTSPMLTHDQDAMRRLEGTSPLKMLVEKTMGGLSPEDES